MTFAAKTNTLWLCKCHNSKLKWYYRSGVPLLTWECIKLSEVTLYVIENSRLDQNDNAFDRFHYFSIGNSKRVLDHSIHQVQSWASLIMKRHVRSLSVALRRETKYADDPYGRLWCIP